MLDWVRPTPRTGCRSRLLDTDVTQSGVQASCKVWLSVPPVGSPNGPYTESSPFPQCDDALSVLPCWQVSHEPTRCPDTSNEQLIQAHREAGATTFNEGTVFNVQCQACPDTTVDTPVVPGCEYGL